MNAGGQISVDGLNYYNFNSLDGTPTSLEEVDLNFTNPGEYYDVNKPHKEMRAFPLQVEDFTSHLTLQTEHPHSWTHR